MIRTIKFWLLFILAIEPIAGILVYYFKSSTAVSVLKGITILSVLLMLFCLRTIERKNQLIILFTGFVLLILPLAVTSIHFAIGKFYSKSFFSQFFGSLLFVSAFVVGYQKIDARKILAENGQVILVILIFSTLSIFFFRLNPFGLSYYPSFQSTYLLPLFAFFVASKRRFYIIWLVILLFLHQKLAIVFIALLLMGLQYFVEASFTKKIFIVLIVAVMVSLIIVKLSQREIAIPLRVKQSITSIQDFRNGDLSKSFNSSLGEKLNEIYSATSQLMTNPASYVFGNGFGWRYKLFAPESVPHENEESYFRYYLHNSIIYNVIAYGIGGVLLLLIYFYKSLRELIQERKSYEIFYPVLALAFLLESLSTLGLYTNIWVPLAIGNLYMHLRRERKDE